MDLNSFAGGLAEEIMEDLAHYSGNAEETFVNRVCADLAESGVVTNVLPSSWQKGSLGIKVNAHSYNEEERHLALFVTDLGALGNAPATISRTDVAKGLRRAGKFFEYAAGGKLSEFIEESDLEAGDLASLIESQAPQLRQLDVYLLTNRIYRQNEAIELVIDGVTEVNVHVWDIERLFQLSNERSIVNVLTLNFAQDFGETFEMLQVPGSEANDQFDCYVGYIPGTLLAKAYKRFGQRLIERNVRSFLQVRGKVNKGIKQTLYERQEMFVAYNNGISTTATGTCLTPLGHKNLFRVDALTGWQIVNGGQTTASLHNAWEEEIDLSNVYVQAKLTVLKSSNQEMSNDLISRISQYANTQNKISFSDLDANDPLHVKLEQASRRLWAPDPQGRKSEKKWYYERARGQYLVDLNRQPTSGAKTKFRLNNPKDQVITKTEFAKYYMAWEQMPHIVSRGSEDNFTEFMRLVGKSDVDIDQDFFKQGIARALLFTCCEGVVRKMNLSGFRANVVAYTLSLVSYSLGNRLNLMTIWRRQKVDAGIQNLMRDLAEITQGYLFHPSKTGLNISQWCKKEACWIELREWARQALEPIVRQAAEVAAAAEAETAAPTAGRSKVADPLPFLREHRLEHVDKRKSGGALWVIYTKSAEKLMVEAAKLGYRFRLSRSGSKATKNRAAWFFKP